MGTVSPTARLPLPGPPLFPSLLKMRSQGAAMVQNPNPADVAQDLTDLEEWLFGINTWFNALQQQLNNTGANQGDVTSLSTLVQGGTDGQVLIGKTTGASAQATLTPGTGIAVTNGPSSITVAATAPVPTGAMMAYGAAAAPSGWLLCDGTSYTTASQPALFAVIGYTYGGAGANFNVPDRRGRVSVGAGQGAGLTNRVLGASGGEETHVLTVAELAPHTHTEAGFDGTGGASPALQGTANDGGNIVNQGSSSTGSGTGHNNMQPFGVDTWIIKT